MDFRELLNKIDAVNTEAKKEPERLAFADAIDHVKDIKFTPPLPSGIKFSSANNIKFRGQDINDPKVKLALFQDELKNSPARLLGEIGSRIKPTSDAQMDLSGHIAALGEKLASGSNSLAQLSEPEKKLAIEAIKSALRGMELERDPDQSEYKDDEDEMESIKVEGGMKQAEIEVQDWFEEFNKYKGTNGDDLAQGWIRATLDTGIMADAYDENEVEAFNKMKGYKGLDADWQDGDHEDFRSNKSGASPITAKMFSTINAIMNKYGLDEEDVDTMSKANDPSYGKPDMRDEGKVEEGDNIYHSCVKSFKHEKFGEGEVLHSEHTLSESGEVSHYDAKFVREDGSQFIVRNIPVANMKECVVVEHGHPKKKKKVKEDAHSKDMEANLPKIMKMKKELMGKGMKSGDAMDHACDRYGFDPDDVAEYMSRKESVEDWFQGQTSVTLEGDSFYETFGWIGENEENIEEAEYQGRTVKLNKPMRGDVKKFKVYVKNPKGNVVKVNFGDPDMKIKKSNPARRRSFRARHNCDTPGPKHKARYWSCRKW